MATLFLHRAPRALGLGLGLSSAFAAHAALRARWSEEQQWRPVLCESAVGQRASGAFRTYTDEAQAPLVTRDGRVNRRVFGQVSSGSIVGLIGGLAVSTFSKTLTVLIGMFVAGVQYLETRGIHIIPTSRIQSYFKSINVRSAVEDNVAFKISFGTVFALAAFAEF